MCRTAVRWTGLALAVLSASAIPRFPAHAQSGSDGPVSPDSADAIRASLKRPPPRPPFEALDAVTLPIRIVALPLRAISWGFGELIGLATKPGEPPAILRALGRAGFRLGFGSIGPRSGIAARVGYVRASPLFLEAALSVRLSQQYRGGVRLQGEKGRFLEAAYTFQRSTQPHFWGIGPATEEDARHDYLWDWQSVSVLGGSRLARLRFASLRFMGELAVEDNRIGRGRDDDVPNLQDNPGFAALYGVNERAKYLRVGLAPILDFTHQSGFQRHGASLELGVTVFRGIDGTDSDFHRFNLILQGYVPLNPRQNLALQFLSEINREDRGGGIPFYHLARFGSRLGGRSLHSDRFRDRDMVALMTEWRFEIWRELHERTRAESFVFFDIGGVEHEITDLSLSETRQSFGFGWRVVSRRRGLFVATVAFGDEGPRLRATLETEF